MTKASMWGCISLLTVIVVLLSCVKYKEGEINYLNSDATWHVLLTMTAYDATPIRQHKFLPIVTLGNPEDKNIRWGGTIPDKKGNYYYTSFSPAGFLLPYCFIKTLNLPINEKSLYIFNTFLFCVSAIIWFFVLYNLFRTSSNRTLISFIGSLVYICSPELLLGMGIVYWHQSIMQVILPLQFLCYYIGRRENKKIFNISFYVLTILSPYTEWTGYVANAGYFIAEIILSWRESKKKAFFRAGLVAVLTVLSSMLFFVHYLSAVSYDEMILALKNRFYGRNISQKILYIYKVGWNAYIDSFYYLLLLFIFLSIVSNFKNCLSRFDNNAKLIVLLLALPLVENIIMMPHALMYTYDRMKGIFVLSFCICYFLDNTSLQISEGKNRKIFYFYVFLTILCCFANVSYFLANQPVWKTDYRERNEKFARYINEKFPAKNSVLTCSNRVRGYLTCLFQRGIHQTAINTAIAVQRNKQHAVHLLTSPQRGDLDKVTGAIVQNLSDKSEIYIKNNDIISATPYTNDEKKWRTFYLTNNNWERGYSPYYGGFFVSNTAQNRKKYVRGAVVVLPDNSRRKIVDVHVNGAYLNIRTEGKKFTPIVYPHELKIELP